MLHGKAAPTEAAWTCPDYRQAVRKPLSLSACGSASESGTPMPRLMRHGCRTGRQRGKVRLTQ